MVAALVDGGIANNTPISTAFELGAERMIVLPTGFSCSLEDSWNGPIAVALHALNLLTARQLVQDVERYSERLRIAVVPPLCPLKISPYDFSRAPELIDRAYESTRRWLAQGGLEGYGVPGSLRAHSHPKSGLMVA